jgi:transcriptional regulator with XRE-family HTH domain
MDPISRFCAWTDARGGVTRAAEVLGVDAGHVSRIRRGKTRPGLGLAVKIEERTRRLPGGPIRVRDWPTERAA